VTLRVDGPDLQRIARYYDAFAEVAEERYTSNQVLARVREGLRLAVERYPADSVLDLGCGPGTDLAYFADRYPNRRYFGVDVSERMVALAHDRLRGVARASAARGCAHDVPKLIEDRFELIYSFFGPLNTEPDLPGALSALRAAMKPGGVLVLSFVNRVYVIDSLLQVLRGRPLQAIARIRNRWNGYSDKTPLETRLYFPRQLERIFRASFRVERREGFSIIYPAWYRAARFRNNGRLLRALWLCDRGLTRTPFWSLGEHLLYVLRAR
jgi:SAM-dependent methyltransferase